MFSGLLGIGEYPLKSSHLMVLEMFVIGVPSFFLAFQPNTNRLQGKFLGNLLLNAVPGGVAMLINAAAVMVFRAVVPGGTAAETTSLLVLGMTFAGVIVLSRMCTPFTKITFPTFASMFVLIIILFTFNSVFGDFFAFGVTRLGLQDWLFFLVITLASNSIYLFSNIAISRVIRSKRPMLRRKTD